MCLFSDCRFETNISKSGRSHYNAAYEGQYDMCAWIDMKRITFLNDCLSNHLRMVIRQA